MLAILRQFNTINVNEIKKRILPFKIDESVYFVSEFSISELKLDNSNKKSNIRG